MKYQIPDIKIPIGWLFRRMIFVIGIVSLLALAFFYGLNALAYMIFPLLLLAAITMHADYVSVPNQPKSMTARMRESTEIYWSRKTSDRIYTILGHLFFHLALISNLLFFACLILVSLFERLLNLIDRLLNLIN